MAEYAKSEQKILDPILRLPQVKQATGLSRATIYKMAASGKFPKPIKISARASGWRESSIIAFLDSLEEA